MYSSVFFVSRPAGLIFAAVAIWLYGCCGVSLFYRIGLYRVLGVVGLHFHHLYLLDVLQVSAVGDVQVGHGA